MCQSGLKVSIQLDGDFMTDLGFKFNTTYTQLPKVFFTKCLPAPVSQPTLVLLNHELVAHLGLDFSSLSMGQTAQIFSGQMVPKGAEYFSQAYAGHQFGYFTILGDGRAHIWGEHSVPGDRTVDIAFKGSGLTPYSRGGDGFATLEAMLREYLISEAMHHLGISTTRSLALVVTGQNIERQTTLPGAILTRVASSHIRVGTFEFAYVQNDLNALTELLDYTVKRHYPSLQASENKPLELIRAFMERQIDLVVHWMRVGFVHGVMNTDNMCLSGETIDYGPCAFMDEFRKDVAFSYIDQAGRYAYANQPIIAKWNIARFSEALTPLIDSDENKANEKVNAILKTFDQMYDQKWTDMMKCKLGLLGHMAGDRQLIHDLLFWMESNDADFTNTFLALTELKHPSEDVYQCDGFKNWYNQWTYRLSINEQPIEMARSMMKESNPLIIPRNHQVQKVLSEVSRGDFDGFDALMNQLKTPYKDQPGIEQYQAPPEPHERILNTFCGT